MDNLLIFKNLTTPLHIDCSLEYDCGQDDLGNHPEIPKNSTPLLIIHPDYQMQQRNIGHGGRGVKRGHFQPWVEPQEHRGHGVKRGRFQPWVETQDPLNEGCRVKKASFQPLVEPQDPLNEGCGVKKAYFQPWVQPRYPLKENCEFQTRMYSPNLEKRTQREIDDLLLFENLTMPLHIDCSLEYEVVDEITIPEDSKPLLIIHPDYQMPQEQGLFSFTPFFWLKNS